MLFVISSIFNPIYSQRRSGRNNKRAASTGRSTKRAATSGRSTKRAATTGRSTKRAVSNGRTSQRAGRSTRRSATNGGGGEVRTVNNSTSCDNASLEDRIKSLEDLVALHETKLKEFEGKLLSTPAGDVASGTSANAVDCENSDYGILSFVRNSENDSWMISGRGKLDKEKCEKIKNHLTDDFALLTNSEALGILGAYINASAYEKLVIVGNKLKYYSPEVFMVGDYIVEHKTGNVYSYLKTAIDRSLVLYDNSNRPVLLYDIQNKNLIYNPDKDLVSNKFANKEWSFMKTDGSKSWTKGYRPFYMNFYYDKNKGWSFNNPGYQDLEKIWKYSPLAMLSLKEYEKLGDAGYVPDAENFYLLGTEFVTLYDGITLSSGFDNLEMCGMSLADVFVWHDNPHDNKYVKTASNGDLVVYNTSFEPVIWYKKKENIVMCKPKAEDIKALGTLYSYGELPSKSSSASTGTSSSTPTSINKKFTSWTSINLNKGRYEVELAGGGGGASMGNNCKYNGGSGARWKGIIELDKDYKNIAIRIGTGGPYSTTCSQAAGGGCSSFSVGNIYYMANGGAGGGCGGAGRAGSVCSKSTGCVSGGGAAGGCAHGGGCGSSGWVKIKSVSDL